MRLDPVPLLLLEKICLVMDLLSLQLNSLLRLPLLWTERGESWGSAVREISTGQNEGGSSPESKGSLGCVGEGGEMRRRKGGGGREEEEGRRRKGGGGREER